MAVTIGGTIYCVISEIEDEKERDQRLRTYLRKMKEQEDGGLDIRPMVKGKFV